MGDDDFQWDDRKAASNFVKHGISFEMARSVFDDPLAIEKVDDREDYGEERIAMIGMTSGRLLYVVYAERAGAVRIISARGAEKHEQRAYFEENA
jgi:uncharacterized DUF497 family protein